MKIYINISDVRFSENIAGIIARHGHKIVSSANSADVIIVDSKQNAYNYSRSTDCAYFIQVHEGGKGNAAINEFFSENKKLRIFVCPAKGPYDGIGSVLLALTKIQPR